MQQLRNDAANCNCSDSDSYEQENRFFQKTLDLPQGGRPILITKIWPIFSLRHKMIRGSTKKENGTYES
jgi:hypothetical protein